MNSTKIVDFIILGGGCSSLSFINNVIEKKITDKSFIIIEKRKEYSDDKSWCFWEKENHKFKSIVENTWDSCSFSLNDKNNLLKAKDFKYQYIRSINFYNLILKKIKKKSYIKLKFNESVKKIKYSKYYYEVITNKNVYLAKNILDSRPSFSAFKKNTFIYQAFVGYEIKFEKDIGLNKKNAYLMQDMQSDENNFYFEYILPLKQNTYLLEYTIFSKTNFSYKKIEDKLKNILKNKYKFSYKLVRKEYGKIPMGFIKNKYKKNKKNYNFIGSLSGAIRPSSGYAFLNIQKWAEKKVMELKKYGEFRTNPEVNYISLIMDKLFLRVISKNFLYAPKIFYYFSKNINPETFVKFMKGDANIFDYCKVIYSMPKMLFLKCLIKK